MPNKTYWNQVQEIMEFTDAMGSLLGKEAYGEGDRQETQEILRQTKETLHDFAVAYDKQFNKVMNLQLNDMEAELKVARQVLDGDGIEKGTRPQILDEEKTPAKSAAENGWLTPRNVGAAALTILGAVGLYKLLGKQNDKTEK